MRKRILAPAFAVMLTTLGTAAPIGEPPECMVAQQWVDAHAGELPTTLAELSRHSMAYRRAIYQALPPATREALWREQLEGYLRPRHPLSEAQQAAVRQVIAKLPALTAATPDRAEARRMRAHLSTLFDQQQFRELFIRLGSEPARAQGESRLPSCDCIDDPDCSWGTVCKYSFCNFTIGCGFAGADECLGVCRL